MHGVGKDLIFELITALSVDPGSPAYLHIFLPNLEQFIRYV